MTNKQNEFIIGLSMTIAIVVLIVSVLWLGKSNFFVNGTTINLLVNNANGIVSGEEVTYRGLKVGNVTNTSIANDKILLELKIEKIEKIPKDSKFEIKDLSLISGKIVEITPGSSNIYLESGDTVKGVVAYGLNHIVDDLKELKPKINGILTNVDTLIGNSLQSNLNHTLKNFNSTINQLKKLLNGDLKKSLANINDITKDNKTNISELLKSLTKRSEELSTFLKSSSATAKKLDALLTAINNDKGSLGSLIKNKSLYNNLDHTLLSLDSLITDFKNNPDKYINVSVF